jgi:hypothetical protein
MSLPRLKFVPFLSLMSDLNGRFGNSVAPILISRLGSTRRSAFAYSPLAVSSGACTRSGSGTNAKCRPHRVTTEFGYKAENIYSR